MSYANTVGYHRFNIYKKAFEYNKLKLKFVVKEFKEHNIEISKWWWHLSFKGDHYDFESMPDDDSDGINLWLDINGVLEDYI